MLQQLICYPVVTVCLLHGLVYELLRDLSGGLLVEDGVHEGDPGGAAAGLGFCRAILKEGRKG